MLVARDSIEFDSKKSSVWNELNQFDSKTNQISSVMNKSNPVRFEIGSNRNQTQFDSVRNSSF